MANYKGHISSSEQMKTQIWKQLHITETKLRKTCARESKLFLVLRLSHTSRVFVVERQIFCRSQIGLNFIGLPACRTLADYLSRLTAFRLGAESSKIKIAPIHPLTCFSWQFLIGLGAREPRQIVLVHRTLADKARQDVLRSNTVRYRPTSPDLVADLSEFTAH